MHRTLLLSLVLASSAGCVGAPAVEGNVTEASHFNPGGPSHGYSLCSGPMWTFWLSNFIEAGLPDKKPGAIFNPSQYDAFCGGYQFDLDGVYGEDMIFFKIDDVDDPIANPLYCASYQFTWSAVGHNARTDKWIKIPGESGTISANNDPRSPVCRAPKSQYVELVHLIPYDKIRFTVDAHVLAADGTVIPRWIQFYGTVGILGGGQDGSGEYPTQ